MLSIDAKTVSLSLKGIRSMKNLMMMMTLFSLSLMSGCTKPESKITTKLVGNWKAESNDFSFTFARDNTGFLLFNNQKVPLKWYDSGDGTLKAVDVLNETTTLSFVGGKLAVGGSHNYLVKVK